MAERYDPPSACEALYWEGCMRAMSAPEFVAYWHEAEPYAAESIGEHETQYLSECALFGDAGPGQCYYLRRAREDYARCEGLHSRLMPLLYP